MLKLLAKLPGLRSLIQLTHISISTLARRLTKFPRVTPRCNIKMRPISRIRSAVPVDRYRWDEDKPGALEVDLVEHNGGSSSGHYAYTINLVDVVTFYSTRRTVLGRAQARIHEELSFMISQWPYSPWALHSDNGNEFLNDQLIRYCKSHDLSFTRGRPYAKNDQAHVEQRNRQLVREVVGYSRYETEQEVEWLNQVYSLLDLYANFFCPSRKVVEKTKVGSKTSKRYDTAKTPFQRLIALGILDEQTTRRFRRIYETTNPLALHRELERLIHLGPTESITEEVSL